MTLCNRVLSLAVLTAGLLLVNGPFAPQAEAGEPVGCTNCYHGHHGHHGHVRDGQHRLGMALRGGANRIYPAPDPSAVWNHGYYHLQYGVPVALVVPPGVQNQGHYSWGTPASHTWPVPAQFGYGPAAVGGVIEGGYPLPTPYYPSHTAQFGVYPVRGPWW